MSEQEAFKQWHTNKYLAKEFGALTLQAAWQAACEWRDSQSPTAQINQRLVEALEIIAGRKQCIDNLMSNADIAKAALDAVRSGK